MPIVHDTDENCSIIIKGGVRYICCYKCNDINAQLIKLQKKPPKYICINCEKTLDKKT